MGLLVEDICLEAMIFNPMTNTDVNTMREILYSITLRQKQPKFLGMKYFNFG